MRVPGSPVPHPANARSPHPRSIEGVLESLRRGSRQLTRNPRAAIETAVKQLLTLGAVPPLPVPRREAAPTYRIDDLARAAGTTVRNIRAYQERGLLHAPRRVGRTAVFDDSHLSRLKIITSMLERGYTSAHILEMLTAWEHGKDLSDVLGLEHALVPAQTDDEPTSMTLAAARTLAGGRAELDQLAAGGLVQITGGRARVLRPKLIAAFAEMREYGMSMADLVALHRQLVPAIDGISRSLVAAGVQLLGPRFQADTPPTNTDVAELVALLTRFRTLAITSVSATLATSIEQTIEGLLADYLAHFVRTAETSA